MELWITATLAAALFQTLRFMLHKVLSMGTLTTAGSTFARFAYASPLALILTTGYVTSQGQGLPEIGGAFLPFAIWGGISQILATLCVVALFRSRNFAVGITFKKTEVIQTALVALVVLGEALSGAGWVAILVGLVGVLLLSDPPQGDGTGGWRRFANRAAGLGLLSGLLFAFSAVGYRGATLAVDSADPLMRAAIALACVTTGQALGMGAWLAWRDRGQLAAVWSARRTAVWLGAASMAGTLCWFTAFTLQTVAYVQALGQIELVFSLLAATLFFRERITMRELAGMGVLALSILLLILLA